ncbi:MAG: hypothetical protein O7C98_10980, partial [Planctomycetota bacterium]|nr:hypothetical protein [Planctomycetota bacterium]
SWIAPLLLPALLLPLQALAQETLEGGEAEQVTHAESGFSMVVPDGWDREPEREGAGVLVHAVYMASKGKQVRLEVSVESTLDFDIDLWIENQREVKQDLFGKENITEAFSEYRDETLGGLPARGFIIAGKTEIGQTGKIYPLHYKVYGVVNEDWFITVQEISYNGAHEDCVDALEAFWGAIKLSEPKPAELDLTPPDELGGATFTDKPGNIKLIKLPAGWVVTGGPPDDTATQMRMLAQRLSAEGQGVARLTVRRFLITRTSVFKDATPTTWINDQKQMWEADYGHADFAIDVDEGSLLGRAEKSGEYIMRGWTKGEQDEIKEAEDLQQRGEKVKIPNFPKTVLRGRIAMISPYVYITEFKTAAARLGDHEQLVAELQRVHESFQFVNLKPGLPPLRTPDGDIGDTLAGIDPKAKVKKEKLFRPELEFKVPPGLKRIEKGGATLMLAGQNAAFDSVTIIVSAGHRADLPPRTKFAPRRQEFDGYRSNWANLATRTGKLQKKPKDAKFGNVKVDAFYFTGKVDGFPAARTQFYGIKKGWRFSVRIDYRGNGKKVFEKQVKAFLKSVKLKD